MKIAHVVSTFPPYHGGMGNAAYQYAKGLSENGHLVTVITPDWAGSNITQSPQPLEKFQVRRIRPAFSYGNSAFLGNLPELVEEFDLVHLHYPFLGAESILQIKKPLITTYQMDLIGSGWKKTVFDYYQKWYLPKFLKRSDQLIFTSTDYLDHSRAAAYKNMVADKINIIPLGVGPEFRPAPRDKNFWSKLGVKETKIILFVGGLDSAHYFKGIDNLISAFANLKDDQSALVIVGEGDLRPAYEAKVKELNLKNVYFLGRASSQQLITYNQQCDFTVLPSIDSSEAFGLVILEAMACAKPVIASNLPGVRQLIEIGRDGLLVKPGDIQDLAGQLAQMLKLDTVAMGANASRKIEERFRWPKIIAEIEAVYRKAL